MDVRQGTDSLSVTDNESVNWVKGYPSMITGKVLV